MPASLTPAERLSRFRQSLPDETRLAEALSLAVRVEPALLRDVRLILFPRSKASLEADLYFSPLVSQRTTDWISLDPQLSLELQSGLTDPLKRAGAYRNGILQAREAIVRVHRRAPFEIATEEEVIWLAVRRHGNLAGVRAAIDARLRELLMRMLWASEESVALARWFASAAHRMPMLARETEAFSVLAFATNSTLGGRKIETRPNPSLATFEALARYLPESAKRIPLWMGLTTRGLHILPSAAPGYERIEAPLTNPVLLDVRGGDTARRLVQVTPGQAAFVPLATKSIEIRTLLRDSLTFRPRPQRTESAAAGSQASTSHIKRMFVTYETQNRLDLEFVRRLMKDLQSRDYEVGLDMTNLNDDADWDEKLQNAIENSDCMIVVVRPSPSGTKGGSREAALPYLLRSQVYFALDREKPIIPILRSGDASLLPYQLRSLNFVDFRENVSYDQAFETLVKALTYWGAASPIEGELVGVPPLPEHYTSRPEILRRLEHLTSGRQGIVALIGRGGIGKTALAINYARTPATREAFPGGIVWVNLVKEDELQRRAQQNQPHLLIADDIHTSKEVDRLSAIMGPQSRLLFTTREPYHADPVTTIDLDRSSIHVSYSHKDMIWFDRLSKFLEPSKHNIDVWEDMSLSGNNLDTILYSRAAVLFVSADYLAADNVVLKQLPLMIEAAGRGELRIIWIAVSACPWESTPLAEIQAANNPDKPLNLLPPAEQDRELARIARMIADAAGGPPPDSA